MKKTAVIIGLILLALLLAGTGFYFGYWRSTPLYSMSLAKNAIQLHDTVEFQRRIDTDSVLSYAYDDVSDAVINQTMNKVPILGSIIGKNLARGAADIAKGKIIEITKNRIFDYVENGNAFSEEEKKDGAFGMNINFAVLDSLVLGSSVIEYTNIEGDTAIMGVKLFPKNIKEGFVFDLEMHKFHGVWRLTRIKNLKEFCDLQERLEAERSAAAEQQ